MSIPRPSRPSNGPPTMALPALPVCKTRKSTGGLTAASPRSAPATPKSAGLRAPSSNNFGPATPAPTGSLPQPRSVSGISSAGRTLRKTVSISAFPHPPRADGRISSLPPSPLSAGAISSRKSIKSPTTPTYQSSHSTPSLLNGTGDGKSVSRLAGTRNSDGLISVASPPQSRSSSAQDSYSTSATQYEDADMSKSDASASNKRSSKMDGKGNVVVSVRVRPDAAGNDHVDGEWVVEGRKALVSYRGREGGDYIYGKLFSENNPGYF